MEQINEQIKSLENLIRADPKNFINYFYLGDIYRKIKKYDSALNNYQKSIQLNNKFPEGFNNLANIYREIKDTKNSILFFKKAIELNPNYINAIYNLGVVYFEVEKYDESSNCFKRVLEISPKHLASLNNLGLLFKKIKYYEEALKCFEKVINIDINFLKAYNNIGTISLELGNIKNAILNYKKVLQLDSPECENQLAECVSPAIINIADQYSHILAPATTFGKNIMPRVAAILDISQVSDIIKVISADTFLRPIYDVNAFATVKSKDEIKFI